MVKLDSRFTFQQIIGIRIHVKCSTEYDGRFTGLQIFNNQTTTKNHNQKINNYIQRINTLSET